jgi:hypothetical protein
VIVESEKACVNGQVFVERGWVGGDTELGTCMEGKWVFYGQKNLLFDGGFQHVTS